VSGNSIPPFRLEFETDWPKVNYTTIDWAGPVSPIIYLNTNVPISARELQRRIVLEPVGQTGPSVRVKASYDPDPAQYLSAELQFVVKPTTALSADASYAVRVRDGLEGIDAGLVGAAHNAGSFRTHAAFEFMGIGCGPHADRSYWEHQHPLSIPLKPDCAPEQPVVLLFAAEPDDRGLYAILANAGLPVRIARTFQIRSYLYQRGSNANYQSSKVIYGIKLSGFPAGETNNVTLPATIRDRFGRELEPTSATFPTRNFVPAFLNHLTLGVIGSGTGEAIKISTVNSDAVAARLYRDGTSSTISLSLDTQSPELNERSQASLEIEKVLGKPWGILIGEIAVNDRVMQNKHALRGFPSQYALSVGAILSPWDVIVAAQGLGLLHRHSIWVSSLETGEAVSDAKVELLERPSSGRNSDSFLAIAYTSGNVLGTARTDGNGFAEIFPSPQTPTNIYPSTVRVTKGGTVVVLPIEAYQFAHNIDERPDYRRNYSPHGGYLGEGAIITWGVTDKPLYRSGETVRIKGYARVRDDNRLIVPGQKKSWKLSCAAYPNDLCAGRTVDLDEYGAFETTLDLPESVLDGEYKISVESGLGGLAAMSFRVANYKPKPHQVFVEIAAERVTGNNPIPVQAATKYFAGGALKNAEAQVIIEARTESPPVPERLLADYYFGPRRWYRGQTVSSVSEAKFDERGRLTGSFPLPTNSPTSGVATVTVGALHDGGEWAYSKPMSIEYVQKPFILGLEQKGEFIAPDEAYGAGVVLLDLQGVGTDDLSVVQTLEYPSNRYSGKTPPPADEADRCTVAVAANDPVSCELTPTRIGRAVIRAKLMRGSEEILQVERNVTIAESSQRPWYRKSDRFDMELKGVELRANQTAEILVDVPYDTASVLFSIHRNFLLDQWREVLSKGKNTIRIPLTEKHTPGFTITAIARPTGSTAGTSIGSKFVKVLSVEEFPELTIASDKEDYKAGEQVKLTVRSSAMGKTQLAVAVIDEAVLDLVPDVDDFFDPQGKRFAGLLELWGNYRWWQLSRAMEAGELSGSELEEISVSANRYASDSSAAMMSLSVDRASGATASAGAALRHDFVEAAYFNPNVLTSDAGIAEINFTVPDNLGRWRVVVIGATTEGQLFANTGGFNVALPLEVRADLPTRLIMGDSLEPRATVLNRKADATEVTLSLNLDAGNGEVASASQTVTLNPMDSMAVSAAVGPVSGEEVKLIARATDSEDTDGIVVSTPVVQPIEARSWTSTAPLATDGGFVQAIELPVNARVNTAELRVTLDKSVIGDLSQTFHYMGQEGHRSWEQILSRAVVAAYANSWDEGSAYRLTKVEMLNRLMQGTNFQSASGGMSHFEPRDDRANDYLSAYTILALSWINDLGFGVPQYSGLIYHYLDRRVRDGMRNRARSYEREPAPSGRDMPIMIAALSSSPFGGARLSDRYSQYLRSNVDKFDVDGLAYALITATNIGASSELRAELSGRLQARLVETFDRTEISGGDYRFGNRNELYCVVLAALQDAGDHAPEPRALAKLVRGGYEFRDQNSGFGNTHANAVCISALTKYRNIFEASKESISAKVMVPRLKPFLLSLKDSESSSSSESVSLPLDDRHTEVVVNLTSGTAGYGSTNVRYEVDLSKEIERSHGYTLKRSYSVYRRNEWRPFGKGSRIERGDWVRIELDVVTPVVRRFVAITDPTPAGLEPVDPSLSSAVPSGVTQRVQWWDAFNRQALSNVQSRFYAEWLSAGSHTVTYYAQAKFAGEFLALPAKVESMYSDGVFATTSPTTIRVQSVAD